MNVVLEARNGNVGIKPAWQGDSNISITIKCDYHCESEILLESETDGQAAVVGREGQRSVNKDQESATH